MTSSVEEAIYLHMGNVLLIFEKIGNGSGYIFHYRFIQLEISYNQNIYFLVIIAILVLTILFLLIIPSN